MRLLYIALDCPLPANNGLRLRTSTVLRALRSHGCRTTLVCLQTPLVGPERQSLQELCDVYWLLDQQPGSMTRGGDWSGRLRSVFSTLPYAARRFRSASARALLRQLCESTQWDAIVCDTVYGVITLPSGAAPLVINHHNLEHRIFDTFRQSERSAWKRAAAAWEAHKVRRWELRAGRRAVANWVCSQVDAEGLRQQQPDAPVAIIPNVAPDLRPDAGAEEEGLVVFQGALDWFPNRDAVQYYLDQIWPLILQRQPAAQFLVVGRNPPAGFAARCQRHPHVRFTGTVADTRPYLARASVTVVPLRIGSGTRLKILEAAAMGKATVATPLGAEGLAFRHGEEICIAETPQAMAAAVTELLASPGLRQRMGAAARARNEAEYSFPVLCQSVEAGLRLLQSHPTAAAGAPAADLPTGAVRRSAASPGGNNAGARPPGDPLPLGRAGTLSPARPSMRWER